MLTFQSFTFQINRLDGLKPGPIVLGELSRDSSDASSVDWWSVARPAIEARMARYNANECSFNLLTVCPQRSVILERKIQALNENYTMETDDSSSETSNNRIVELEQLQSQLYEEHLKQDQQRKENVRRRHNYVPLILEVVKTLAAEQKLAGVRENAKNKLAVKNNA
jgi:ubiquitin carboxyl-terminal hydrolase L5